MELKGSCECGQVSFHFNSRHPYPFCRCYCSICRKTAGGGGYAINIEGDYATLKVKGKKFLRSFHAKVKNPEDERAHRSDGERFFCAQCGSALWVWDKNWPALFHPFASAIDSELPRPPTHVHLMLDFKAPWVELQKQRGDQYFKRYPKDSLAEWHDKRHLSVD